MERTWKIMRNSISTFLDHFHHYTTIPILFMFPFSATTLLSQTLFSSSKITSQGLFFSSPKLNLFLITKSYFSTQTLFSSILIIPFSLSSLLLSKASIIQTPKHDNNNLQTTCLASLSIYKPLLITQLFNMILGLLINIASTSLASIAFNSSKAFGFFENLLRTTRWLVLYAIITNTVVVFNLSLVVAGIENQTGYRALRKAYLLKKQSNSIAMLLALPTNIGLASIEALFCFRVVRDFQSQGITISMTFEGILIACLYSIVLVIDTIACCILLKRFGSDDFSIMNPNGNFGRVEIVLGP